MRAFLLAALLAGLAIACGSPSHTFDAPSPPPSLAGNWSGSVSSTNAGNGTITFTLTQSGSNVSGQWTTTFPGQPPNGGSVSGLVGASVSGFALLATLTPGSLGRCGFDARAVSSGDASMSGKLLSWWGSCAKDDANATIFNVAKD